MNFSSHRITLVAIMSSTIQIVYLRPKAHHVDSTRSTTTDTSLVGCDWPRFLPPEQSDNSSFGDSGTISHAMEAGPSTECRRWHCPDLYGINETEFATENSGMLLTVYECS
jgi:hypothetical protein